MARLLNKINLKAEKITRDRKTYHIIMKEQIYQEDITIISLCAPNHRPYNTFKTDRTKIRNRQTPN